MDQKCKKIKNHRTLQAVVDWRIWLIPQQLQDDKKPRRLEEVQEDCQEYQKNILWCEDSRNSEQEPWSLEVDELD